MSKPVRPMLRALRAGVVAVGEVEWSLRGEIELHQ